MENILSFECKRVFFNIEKLRKFSTLNANASSSASTNSVKVSHTSPTLGAAVETDINTM